MAHQITDSEEIKNEIRSLVSQINCIQREIQSLGLPLKLEHGKTP
jgi:hypothetical protein